MFQPIVPLSGTAGWQFLLRTEESQLAAFGNSALIKRETEYFADNIGNATSLDALMEDRTLLKVALGAFGLEEELPKRAFIREMLEQGTDDSASFANRIADQRWRDFVTAFSFTNAAGPQVQKPGKPAEYVEQYIVRGFEIGVGESDTSMRLALNYRREIGRLTQLQSDSSIWFAIMGQAPVREVVEKALGLPAEFSQIDLDKQVEMLGDRAASILGSSDPRRLAEPETMERVLNAYLVRAQIEQGPAPGTPGLAALSLLQGTGGAQASTGIANLLASLG